MSSNLRRPRRRQDEHELAEPTSYGTAVQGVMKQLSSESSDTTRSQDTEIDLEEIIRLYAQKLHHMSESSKDNSPHTNEWDKCDQCDNVCMGFNIDMTDLLVEHGELSHKDTQKPWSEDKDYTMILLDGATMTNTSDSKLTTSMDCSKTSISQAQVKVTNPVRFGSHRHILDINVPKELNGICPEVLKVDKCNETFSFQRKWSLKNKVTVPPRKSVRAEIKIQEEKFSSNFVVETRLKGRVKVTTTEEGFKSPKYILQKSIYKILKHADDKYKSRFEFKDGWLSYRTDVQCHFAYGVEATVNIEPATSKTCVIL